jgi:hypothetical protein
MKNKHLMMLLLFFALLLPGTASALDSAMEDQFKDMLQGWAQGLIDRTASGQIIDDEQAVEDFFSDIQPDYGSLGTFASACKYDEDCYVCMKDHAELAQKLMIALEDVYVIYQRTMKKYDMMIALADGAANLTTYAKYAWLIQKGSSTSEMNIAKENFLNHYDDSQASKMTRLNNALVAIGDCERQFVNNPNWYNTNALPIYVQLTLRYKR